MGAQEIFLHSFVKKANLNHEIVAFVEIFAKKKASRPPKLRFEIKKQFLFAAFHQSCSCRFLLFKSSQPADQSTNVRWFSKVDGSWTSGVSRTIFQAFHACCGMWRSSVSRHVLLSSHLNFNLLFDQLDLVLQAKLIWSLINDRTFVKSRDSRKKSFYFGWK